jgi:FlaG/FlaF family flagellin (archaellin)
MVAITVILAAVIGAFVLEIGDQQETAPNASFESAEQVKTFKGRQEDSFGNCLGTCETNLTQVQVEHVGGSTLDIDQIVLKVNGNGSVWGAPTQVDSYGNDCGGYCSGLDDPTIVPQPNTLATRGTNEQVTFSSGESWEIVGYGGLSYEAVGPEKILDSSGRKLQWAIRDNGAHYCSESTIGKYEDGNEPTHTGPPYNPTVTIFFNPPLNYGSCQDDLDAGDDVTVVWNADSGGKTQKLIGYTVQQSNPNQ